MVVCQILFLLSPGVSNNIYKVKVIRMPLEILMISMKLQAKCKYRDYQIKWIIG